MKHALMFVVAMLAPCAVAAEPGLRVLDDGYPRVFFFRQVEGAPARGELSFEEWDRRFSRLMGIMGKSLDEELPNRSKNIDFFTRFKKAHPDQAVLLHFNGNARDPRFDGDRFFAGHWLYFNGALIQQDVPAEPGETEIKVSNTDLFKTSVGRFGTSNEDIGLCFLDALGKPDWSRSEQVRLISVDKDRGVIKVMRGCYGTEPLAFPADKSYAAAHVCEGPWREDANLLWTYNYSTLCPRDAKGRSCEDVLVDELAELFAPGGPLAAFDGVEFDVLHNMPEPNWQERGVDCDADGKPDGGWHQGSNDYGKGVFEFCRKLREKLGKKKLIMADGVLGRDQSRAQRAFGILNGVESEGWPHLADRQVSDWSGGLNRLFYWDANATKPVLNYINHKFASPGEMPGALRPKIPFNIHRLVFAAGVFTNAALCASYSPPADPDGLPGIWDEFRMGAENRLGWLGMPKGPAMRLALSSRDVLDCAGNPPGEKLIAMISSEDAEIQLDKASIKVAAKDPNARGFTAVVRGIPCEGPELSVFITLRAAPMQGCPPDMARIVCVSTLTGQKLRTRSMTYIGPRHFTAGFYFPDAHGPRVDLTLKFESSEPVWITNITAHACPDAVYREFEHGVVIANPSPRPYTFDLARLFPSRAFRRLKATANQDTLTNNGVLVGPVVTLGAKDALFLVECGS